MSEELVVTVDRRLTTEEINTLLDNKDISITLDVFVKVISIERDLFTRPASTLVLGIANLNIKVGDVDGQIKK